MSESAEVAVAAGLSLFALVLAAGTPRLQAPIWRRRARRLLAALGVVAVAAYVNFGTFHGGGLFPHYWEQFHYFLGSKYFPEVGYDGLYVASMGAQMQGTPGGAFQPFLRDLRSNEVVPTATLADFGYQVRQRFSDERWAELRRDNDFFAHLDPGYLARVRMDHGYNPSPAWTAVARLWSAQLTATQRHLLLLGLLDAALLLAAFIVLFRTYGGEVGLLALVVYATGYGWRFYWTGGAFLRQDWLAALVIAICMLRRRRFTVAGALLAYAAMVRVFPLAFLGGLAVQGVRDLMRGRDWRWAVRLAGGFALGAALLLVAGSATGRGSQAWWEFAANLRKHSRSWLTNNVGLADVILYGPETYGRRLVHAELPEPWLEWQAFMDEVARARRGRLLLAQAALALLVARAALREGPDEAAAAGLALVFAAAPLTCYYWGMLVVAVVRRSRVSPWATAAALLAANLAVCAAHFAAPAFEVRYGAMSWALLAFFLWWLWPFRRALTAERAGGRSQGARRAAASRP